MWAKKEDAPHLQDEDSDDGNSMYEEAYGLQTGDADDQQPSRGKRGKGKASAASGRPNSRSTNDTRRGGVTASPSLTLVSTKSRDGAPKDSQFREGTITMNRLDPAKASMLRANTKELLRVSNIIITLEPHHIAQEITRRMAAMFGVIEVLSAPRSLVAVGPDVSVP
jgi:hypothetical protein